MVLSLTGVEPRKFFFVKDIPRKQLAECFVPRSPIAYLLRHCAFLCITTAQEV